MSKIFDINFQQLFVNLLPTFLRKKRLLAYLGVVASQLQAVHYRFVDYRAGFKSGAASQSCYLRGVLNDWFDPYERRIELRNVRTDYDSLLLWKEAANKPVKLTSDTPFLLQNENSLLLSQIDFEVVLPQGFTLSGVQQGYLKKILENNRLPGKKYIIVNE